MDGFDFYLYYIDMKETALFQGNTVSSKRILYTPSAFARDNLFFLQETGTLQAKLPHMNKRHYLDSFLFLIVVSGSGTIEYEGNVYWMKKGDCAFIDCHSSYSQKSSEDLWTLKWVHFNGNTMHAIYKKFLERSGCHIYHCDNISQYCSSIDRLLVIAESESHVRDMEIHENLSLLLTMTMKDCWKESSSLSSLSSRKSLQSLQSYLQQHFREKISLDTLSEQFFINKYYLTRLFKEQFGKTISEYILELRINQAKTDLRFTNQPIEQIAHNCGFFDIAYFSRKFKKAEGISDRKSVV